MDPHILIREKLRIHMSLITAYTHPSIQIPQTKLSLTPEKLVRFLKICRNNLFLLNSQDDSSTIKSPGNIVPFCLSLGYLSIIRIPPTKLSFETSEILIKFLEISRKEFFSLDLRGDSITSESLGRIIPYCLLLRYLSIDAKKIDDEGFRHIAKLINLESLHIYNGKKLSDEGFYLIKQLEKLKDLNLRCCKITGRRLNAFTSLRSLTLWGCDNLTAEGMDDLSKMPFLTSLKLIECNSLENPICKTNCSQADASNCQHPLHD